MNQIQVLIHQLIKSGNSYDYILAPARGGLVPAQYIAYALGIKTIHTISNVRGDYPRSHRQRVLIVDDINDSSDTVLAMIEHLEKYELADTIDVAVMYERYSSKYKAPFVGEYVNHDKYIYFDWDKEPQDAQNK